MTSWKSFIFIISACFLKSFVFILTACLLLAAPQVKAQDGGQQEKQKGYQFQQKQDYDFSNNELEKFATAFDEIRQIRSEYSQVISEVKDAEKAQKLQSRYTQKMVKTIEEKGLDVKLYNKISMAMQQDPKIREKVEKLSQ